MIINPYIFATGGGGSFIVDDYSPIVAFSLRQIDSANSDLIRVRRSSDGTEQDFNASEILDGTLTTFTGAGDGFITTWYNIGTGGSTYDATQSTASAQQEIVNSGVVNTDSINGFPAAIPIGTNDFYSLANNLVTTQLFAQAWVFQRTGALWNVSLGRSGVNNPLIMRWDTSDNISTALNTVTVADNDSTTGDILAFTLRDSSNNVKYWLNNTAGTTKTHTGTGTNLDALFGTTSVRHADPVQELIYWNTDVESSRTAIQDNINDYYSIY